MPLINCPECGKSVSSEAHACPVCGYPVAEKLAGQSGANRATPAGGAPEEVLAEIRPSWWGYFWYLFFFFLIVPPFIAYFKRASTVLRIYPHRLMLERGLLSKTYQDINPRDIRSIEIDQSFLDRMVNIGDLTISTAATVDASELLKSIPEPQKVRDIILAQRG